MTAAALYVERGGAYQSPELLERREIYLRGDDVEECIVRRNHKRSFTGVMEMPARILRKTIERRTDGTFTTLHVEATWPYNAKPIRMSFDSKGRILGDPWQEWRLERTATLSNNVKESDCG